MKKNYTQIILLLSLFSIFTSQSLAAHLTAELQDDTLVVNIDGQLFTSYKFAGDLKRPYFYPVVGPVSGKTVTVESTEPYPHHNSLFFGCDQVNGGNYWQDVNERGQILSQGPKIETASGDKVVFTDTCLWDRPDKDPIIKDTRRVTISAPSNEIRFIDFEVTLLPLTDIVIGQTNHSFFSARMRPELNVEAGGTLINAEGKKNADGTFGIESPWCDFYGTRDGITEGLAIFQSPANRWYPSKWFTRDYGFMSPTPMYWPENGKNTTFAKGEELTLRYRVVIHAGDTDKAGIANIFKAYENKEAIGDIKSVADQVALYEQGKSRKPLIELAELVSRSYDSAEMRRSIADAMAGVAVGKGTFEGRKIACEQLSIIGDGSHVEVLTKLLDDEKTADIAIFAMQRINDNKASEALLSALDTATGRTKAAVVNALAERGDNQALPKLAELIYDKDEQIAAAAIAAIGDINTARSAEVLKAAMGKVSGGLKGDVADAMISIADDLVTNGSETNKSEAAKMYADIYNSSMPAHITAAALRGLIASGNVKAETAINEVLAGDNAKLQAVVFESIRNDSSGNVTVTIASRFNKLSDSAKTQFLSALTGSQRRDVDKVVTESALSVNSEVRVAALKAIGRIGDESDVMLLAEAAARAKGEEAKVANQSLVTLVGDGVDTAIIQAIQKADGSVKSALISAVSERGISSAQDVLMDCLADNDTTVRTEAIKALGLIGTAASMPAMLEFLQKTESSRERGQIEKALVYIARENDAYPKLVGLISDEYGSAGTSEAKASMLNMLAQAGEEKSMPILRKGVADSNADVRKSAIKALSEFTGGETAELLATAAKTDASQINRVLAVKGYIKIVTQDADAGLEETVDGLAKAMRLAERVEEKKAVLAILPAYKCKQAVELAKLCLADEALKADAEAAIEKMKAQKFDFQPSGSPIEKGFIQVAISDLFGEQKSFGWTSSPADSRDRNKGTDLARDFVFDSKPKTFKVKLANGKYSVTAFIGDMSSPHDKNEVVANGEIILKDITVQAGQVKEQAFDVTVTDGVLELTFRDTGGSDVNWTCCGLTIQAK